MIGTSDKFEDATVSLSFVDAKDYLFAMECLLYKLGVTDIDPEGPMRHIILSEYDAMFWRLTGIRSPVVAFGKFYDLHQF